jgi:hypothetical protein
VVTAPDGLDLEASLTVSVAGHASVYSDVGFGYAAPNVSGVWSAEPPGTVGGTLMHIAVTEVGVCGCVLLLQGWIRDCQWCWLMADDW